MHFFRLPAAFPPRHLLAVTIIAGAFIAPWDQTIKGGGGSGEKDIEEGRKELYGWQAAAKDDDFRIIALISAEAKHKNPDANTKETF
jgi:hypothetical protein